MSMLDRYTKDDEARIVEQRVNDRILENMTFGELYEKRIVTTLAPLQTYVFEKWHYKRLVTIGDSAHKVRRLELKLLHDATATSICANNSAFGRSIR